jgi:peroxiredoxin Q/BCP
LQGEAKKFAEKNVTVVAISYDPVDDLKEFADKQKVTLPLLSDPDSAAIKAYGLLNKAAKGKQAGIPHPGTVILDAKGVIRAKLFHEGVIKRHTADDILKAVEGIKE